MPHENINFVIPFFSGKLCLHMPHVILYCKSFKNIWYRWQFFIYIRERVPVRGVNTLGSQCGPHVRDVTILLSALQAPRSERVKQTWTIQKVKNQHKQWNIILLHWIWQDNVYNHFHNLPSAVRPVLARLSSTSPLGSLLSKLDRYRMPLSSSELWDKLICRRDVFWLASTAVHMSWVKDLMCQKQIRKAKLQQRYVSETVNTTYLLWISLNVKYMYKFFKKHSHTKYVLNIIWKRCITVWFCMIISVGMINRYRPKLHSPFINLLTG